MKEALPQRIQQGLEILRDKETYKYTNDYLAKKYKLSVDTIAQRISLAKATLRPEVPCKDDEQCQMERNLKRSKSLLLATTQQTSTKDSKNPPRTPSKQGKN